MALKMVARGFDGETEYYDFEEEKPINRIEVPKPKNKDKEEIKKLRTALKDAKYIYHQYKDTLPAEAWETIGLILNDPKLKAKGGTH